MLIDNHAYQNEGPEPVLKTMRNGLFWAGGVTIVLGAAAILMPFLSSLIIEILIGWLLTISGGVALIGAFSLRQTEVFIWKLVAGLIALCAGLLMLVFPLQGLIALTALVAIVMMLSGLGQGAFAFWVRPSKGWGWGISSAILSIVLGGFILFSLPEASAVILGLLVGIDFFSTGLALVLIARFSSSALDG